MDTLPTTRAEALSLGLTRYLSTRPCRFNHPPVRLVDSYGCAECARLSRLRYARSHPEKMAARNARYRQENAEKVAAINAAWKAANKENARRWRKAYGLKHPHKVRQQKAAWRAANADRIKEYERAYRERNPEASKARDHNKRARRQLAAGKHTKADIKRLFEQQKGRCAGCSRSIRKRYHVDHVLALKLGGSNDRSNLQLLCPPCNLTKGAKDPVTWAHECSRLL